MAIFETTLPGIGYKQGGRVMVIGAMDPVALVRATTMPQVWNPLGNQPHGNRPIDKPHVQGIAEYLEGEPNYIIGATVLYASSKAVTWTPDEPDAAISTGKLSLAYGASFDIGDGQHRTAGYSLVISRHTEGDTFSDDGSEVMQRLRESGQPFIIVIDDDPRRRAQDFTDLQRNTKKIAESTGLSMDRRQPINGAIMELIQDPELPLFGYDNDGTISRVEFIADSPGKFSGKLFSFKTVRLISGYALGVNERSTRSWEQAVNEKVGLPGTKQTLKEFWQALSTLPAFAALLDGANTVSDLRKDTYLASAGVLYALAWACHQSGVSPAEFFKAVGEHVDFSRTGTFFEGTIVDATDPDKKKISGGRVAWEAAAVHILAELGYTQDS